MSSPPIHDSALDLEHEATQMIAKHHLPPGHIHHDIELSFPSFPWPLTTPSLPELPLRGNLICHTAPAKDLFVQLATANATYVGAIQAAMAAVQTAKSALAAAEATFYDADHSYRYALAVAKTNQVLAYYTAGLTFQQGIAGKK